MLKSSFVGIAPDLVLPVLVRPQCITHEEYERMNKFLKNTHECSNQLPYSLIFEDCYTGLQLIVAMLLTAITVLVVLFLTLSPSI